MAVKAARRQSMGPQEYEECTIRARRRFKAIVYKVIQNLSWLGEVEDEELGENVAKNILLLTRKKKGKKGDLTLYHKSILKKKKKYRTHEEIDVLTEVFGRLNCFSKFKPAVHHRLAKVTYYTCYEPGKVIIRQGHVPDSLYFILSGSVAISMTRYDPIFNEVVTSNAGTLGPDAMFGEVALLQRITRTATITTITPCELLFVGGRAFNTVMRGPVKRQWDKVMLSLGRFTYFKQWDEVSLRECCIKSRLKSFSRDETILGDGKGFKNSVYFILGGKCKVIEHLLVTSAYNNCGIKKYKLYDAAAEQHANILRIQKKLRFEGTVESKKRPTLEKIDQLSKGNLKEKIADAEEYNDSHLPSNVQTHFMQVCILSELACFGVGENMDRRRIVAITNVDCILIPRYWIFQKNIGNLWTRIQQYLNSHIPNTEAIFQEFLEQRKWREYKKQLVNSIVRRTPANLINHVPYSIRIHEDFDFVD